MVHTKRPVKVLNLTIEELTDINYDGIFNINLSNFTAFRKEIKIKPKALSSSGDLHAEKEGSGSRRECVHVPSCVKDPRESKQNPARLSRGSVTRDFCFE